MATMAETGLRATSLAVSAGLLGLAVLAALTMRFTMAQLDAPIESAPVEIVRPNDPPKPEPEPKPQPDRPLIENPIVIAQTTTPTDVTQPPTPTDIFVITPPSPPVVADPHWTRRPRGLERFYPGRARTAGIEGEVVLNCLVSTQGALDCDVARETPPGWGFGEAAQRISREHRMSPAMRDGVPIEARYRMRVPFRLD